MKLPFQLVLKNKECIETYLEQNRKIKLIFWTYKYKKDIIDILQDICYSFLNNKTKDSKNAKQVTGETFKKSKIKIVLYKLRITTMKVEYFAQHFKRVKNFHLGSSLIKSSTFAQSLFGS